VSGETVLLVGSNEKIVAQLSDAIRKAGYHLTVAQWAEEALTIALKGGIHAILIHTKLPGMNGTQFVQELRREPRFKIWPVIILYGKDDLETKVAGFKAGADDYLVLPFQMPELFLRLQIRINKTMKEYDDPSQKQVDTLETELALPDSLPGRGSLASRSLPMLLGNSNMRGSTGILRLLQTKNVRTIYFEKGMIRGVRSSVRSEQLIPSFIRWRIMPKTAQSRMRAVGAVDRDAEVVKALVKKLGLSPERLNAIGNRYIQYILNKMLKMTKADYDWVEQNDSGGMFLLDPPGIHPIHSLVPAIRAMFFPPSYKLFLPKPSMWITPSSQSGHLPEFLRLSIPETGLFQLITSGKSMNHFLLEGKQIVSHAEQLIHIAHAFNLIQAGEKRPVSKKESATVQPFPAQSSIVVEEENDNNVVEQEIITPEPESVKTEKKSKPQPPAPGKVVIPPLKRKPQTAKRSSEKIRNAPPQSVPEKTKPSKGPRTVKELYPDVQEDALVLPGTFGIEGLGFTEDQLKEGSIAETPFLFLFALALESKKTGVLSVNEPERETKIFWRKGRLLFARTDDPALRIDQIMVDMGMITAAQKSQVEDMIAEMGKMRSGTLIFKKQLVNMLQLSEAIHQQISLILNALFNSTKGTYTFEEGDLPDEEHIPLDLPAENLLVKGIMNIENTSLLEEYFPGMTETLVQTARAKQTINQYKLGPVVTAIFDKFRHPAKVKEAIAGAEISPREFKIVLVTLIIVGLLNYYNQPRRKSGEIPK
jgi:CheY-like chemotaxis protein